MAYYRHSLSSEQSVTNKLPNSMNKQRVLLPLKPDFNTMSDPSIVFQPPTNTWESNRSASLKRPSRRDQPKCKHKKRRRYSLSSSSSSPSSPLSYPRRSRESKKSKHSHKERRRQYPSSSSSKSIKEYGRYQDKDIPLLRLSAFRHHNNLIGL